MCSVLNVSQYYTFAAAADFNAHGQNEIEDGTTISATNAEGLDRRACKEWVEWDRNASAEEANYITVFGRLYHLNASPKNDLIMGIPSERI